MSVVAVEKFGTRRGNWWERAFSYEVYETAGTLLADVAALDAVVAQITADYPLGLETGEAGIYLLCSGVTIEEVVSNDRMIVATQWMLPQEAGTSLTAQYAFSYQAPTEHITRSLATVQAYDATGPITNPFGGAINVSRTGHDVTINGLDLPGGNATSSWTYKTNTGIVTSTYEATIEALMGGVNNATWKTRAAGTMRFVSCAARHVGGNRVDIDFGFQFSANRTSIVIGGGITVASKKGHELLWVYYEDAVEGTLKLRYKKPRIAVVEQVFPSVNFNSFGF